MAFMLPPDTDPRDLEASVGLSLSPMAGFQTLRAAPSAGLSLAEMLRRWLTRPGTAPVSGAGRLAELAQRGQIDRPWPGVYRGKLSGGRTQPKSYRTPKTFQLPESADELRALLETLGGRMGGPTP